MYAPDPYTQDFCDKLIVYKNKGIKGCGELKTPLAWDSMRMKNLLLCVRELKIPLIFQYVLTFQSTAFYLFILVAFRYK